MLVPPAQVEHDPCERSSCRTECVVDPGDSPRLHVRVRCLQVQSRSLERQSPSGQWIGPVDELVVGDAKWVPWDEAVEHEIDLPPIALLPLGEPIAVPFAAARRQ